MANVLYLTNSGDIVGGGQISLINLLKYLNRSRFLPLVVCPTEGKLAMTVRHMGIQVVIIAMGRLRHLNLLSLAVGVRKIIKLVKDRRIDIIHANGSRCMIYGGIAAKICRVPVVWHVRIIESDSWLDKFLTFFSKRIIVISRAVKKRFSWLKNQEKIELIPNGVDLNIYRPEETGKNVRMEYSLGNARVVGIVGQLILKKGHKNFINASKIVSDAYQDVKFLIVGEDIIRNGKYREELEGLVRSLKLDDKIIFTGYRQDIPQVISVFDIFALSSLTEPFGRVLIEAMAMSKPVVATNVGGVPEIVKDGITGILVPPNDPNSMAEAIIHLLKNKEKAYKMGLAGRKRVEEHFSIEINVRKTEELYQEILT